MGAVSEAQGPQRDPRGTRGLRPGIPGSGREQEARRGPRGCTAGRIPVPRFPPLLTGCKVLGIPLQGQPFAPTLPRC